MYYILAERFDADPFLIFAMRGKRKEEFLEGRIERGSGDEPVPDQQSVDTFRPSPLTAAGFTISRSLWTISMHRCRA